MRTTYELDAGPTQTGTSVVIEAPATHANDGVHLITYRSSTIGDVAEDYEDGRRAHRHHGAAARATTRRPAGSTGR